MAGRKRKNQESYEEGSYSTKSRSKPSAAPKLDPTYGQRGAIPGLDEDTLYEEEDGYIYDEDRDAMAYLRYVRQEASAIPNLLVAPKTPTSNEGYEMYRNGVGDFRGRYEDGAYLAEADGTEDEPQQDAEDGDPQTLYFDSIISRYKQLRDRMSQVPPRHVLQALGSDNPTHVGPLNKMLSRDWIRRMQNSDPKPAQIASMPKGSVLRLLRLLTQGTVLRRGSQVEMGMTYWVWSLLARLPERGELNSEEIGVVRELGKKAVLIGMGLKEVEDWQEGMQDVEAQFEEDLNGGGTSVVNDEEIDLGIDDDDEEYAAGNVNHQEASNSRESAIIPSLPVDSTTFDRDGDTEQPVSANSHTLAADLDSAVTAEESQDLVDNESLNDDGGSEYTQSLAAMKARLLGRLDSRQDNLNIEPEVAFEPKPRPSPSRANTRATVDMIITVAGEIYGQRDLLEFRDEWAHIM